MARVDVEDLKNLDNMEKLADIFTHRLNYQYEASVISTRRWKEDITNSIVESEIKLLAKHEDFHIVYCKIESLRLGIERPIVNQLLREHPYLLVIFSDKSNQNWHFVNIKYDEEIKNRRLFRRIVIGPDERLHTAAERINELEIIDDKIGSLEVQSKHDAAFDVEEVTKEFFDKFTDIFHLLCEDIEEENPACKGDCDAQAQLILNRLMFLYFIQKKGWLNNNPQYLYENFLNYWKKDPKGNSYYSQFLLKLCQALSSQTPLYKEILGDVPFLNGGLFEIGPFTSKLPFRLHIKNSTFKNIFDELLERFNFTVREDTPLDVEVAIDPEMLGKVFENLILKLEKGEDLRKKTGSYYTPRIIVHFMCQESLKEYLITESQIEREKIESLFKMHPADQLVEEEIKSLEKSFTVQEARLLKNLIKKAYILDPAVGSGAFLVGMLHEMISVTKLLDVREFGSDYIIKKNYDYELKRELIETSLYGVDIQEQAVRICELRLWLSLIVDYERSKNQDVPSLPNLSYRIRCGDSLIEKLFGHTVQLDQLVQTDKGKQLIDEITKDKEAFFLERDIKEKDRIELSILYKQCELMELLIKEKQKSLSGYQLSLFEETAKERAAREEFEEDKREYERVLLTATNTREKLAAMLKGKISIPAEDMYNLKKKLGISFIWKLDFTEVFKEKGGFDIVIANPPYIQSRNITKEERRAYWGIYLTDTNHSDSFSFFIQKGINLTHDKSGVLSYIVSETWRNLPSYKSLRRYILGNTTIRNILVFSNDYRVFESAEVRPLVVILKKIKSKNSCFSLKEFNKENKFKSLGDFKQSELESNPNYSFNFFCNTLINQLVLKMQKETLKLNDIYSIIGGLRTGEDKKFLKSKKENNDCKKLIRGRDFNRYFLRWNGEWVWYRPDLMKVKQAAAPKDSKCFEAKKIIVRMITGGKVITTLDENHFYLLQDNMILQKDAKYSLEYLVAILNSKLLNFYIGNQISNIAITQSILKYFPIKDCSEQQPFIDLVTKILAITREENYLQNSDKKAKVKEYECQIDKKVYGLYDLTKEEIELVDNSITD